MAKYRYTMRVKKTVVYDEMTIQVNAENEVEAQRLAKIEAQYRNWVDVKSVRLHARVLSYSCKPVEE